MRNLSSTDLATGKAPMAQGMSVGQRSEGLTRSMGSALVIGGPVIMPSPFPYGLSNATTGYSCSTRSTMSSYARLPEHQTTRHR
jgi:hypothetical protein